MKRPQKRKSQDEFNLWPHKRIKKDDDDDDEEVQPDPRVLEQLEKRESDDASAEAEDNSDYLSVIEDFEKVP